MDEIKSQSNSLYLALKDKDGNLNPIFRFDGIFSLNLNNMKGGAFIDDFVKNINPEAYKIQEKERIGTNPEENMYPLNNTPQDTTLENLVNNQKGGSIFKENDFSRNSTIDETFQNWLNSYKDKTRNK